MSDNINNSNDEITNSTDEITISHEPANAIYSGNQSALNQFFNAQISMSVVKSISGWGMFRAVIDIISGVFSCLGGIFFLIMSLIMFISGSSVNNSYNFKGNLGDMSSGLIYMIGVFLLLAAVIYPFIGVLTIIYSVNLIRAIDNLKKAVAQNNESSIIEFFNKLSKFFKFNGIVSILKISLYVLLFIFYILIFVYALSTAGNIMDEFNNGNNFFQQGSFIHFN